MSPEVRVLWEDWADRALGLPGYATAGAAGADIRANLPEADRAAGIGLEPMQRLVVPTGLRVEIPEGFEIQVFWELDEASEWVTQACARDSCA